MEDTVVKADIKLRAASLATPPQSPPPKDEETLGVSQQPIQQRRTVSYPFIQSHASEAANVLHPQANPPRIQFRQSDSDEVTLTPSVVLTAPAHHTFKSTSVPNSPITPPSALASALIGVGTAHALGSSSPRVRTTLSDAPRDGRNQPLAGLGLSTGTDAAIHSLLDQVRDNEHDDHEVATIQRARRASVATATFKTLNPAVGLDAEIDCRSRPSSPVIREIPAPELVYYGSGAISVEEDDEENGEIPVEMFKSLNPHVSLEAEIARRSCPPSPAPQVFVAPQIEDDDDGPIETFKSLNPALSLDAEILRRSRTPSPVPQFKELNEEFSLEREIAKRATLRPASPKPMLTAEDERFPDDANEAENGSRSVAMRITPNRSLVRTTLLPFILGLRMMNIVNPFAYLYLARSRSRSTYRPEPYPKIARSILRMVVPAFIWRWAGKDPSYNLQRAGLGKGVNSVGTQYDESGVALPPTST